MPSGERCFWGSGFGVQAIPFAGIRGGRCAARATAPAPTGKPGQVAGLRGCMAFYAAGEGASLAGQQKGAMARFWPFGGRVAHGIGQGADLSTGRTCGKPDSAASLRRASVRVFHQAPPGGTVGKSEALGISPSGQGVLSKAKLPLLSVGKWWPGRWPAGQSQRDQARRRAPGMGIPV